VKSYPSFSSPTPRYKHADTWGERKTRREKSRGKKDLKEKRNERRDERVLV
jgi:hypothetical protein